MLHARGDVVWLFDEGGGLTSQFRTLGGSTWRPLLGNRETVILALAAMISFLPAWPVVHRLAQQRDWQQGRVVVVWGKFALALALLVLSIGSLANLHFNPFIYFRF